MKPFAASRGKVLTIAWAFPPLLDPEAIQTARCVKYLRLCGWQPLVLTVEAQRTTAPVDPQLSQLVPSDVPVVRTRAFESRNLNRVLARLAPALLALPDAHMGWYPWACRAARALAGDAVLLYSRACPFTSHLVAAHTKRATGLPWVAHFSDPWVESPYFPRCGNWHRRQHERWESMTIEEADALTFSCEPLKAAFLAKYPQADAKSFVTSNCYEAGAVGVLPPLEEGDGKFTLTHTGSLYGARSPSPLLKAVAQLLQGSPELQAHLQVLLVGGVSKEHQRTIARADLNGVVRTLGTVPYFDSLAYMQAADVLVLIDAPTPLPSVFLPAKLLDYLAASKPILGITPRRGAAADLLRLVGGYLVTPEDTEGIARCIQTLYQQHQQNRLQRPSPRPTALAAYEARTVAQRLAEVFDWTMQQCR